MNKILYCNSNTLANSDIGTFLTFLPSVMQADIMRFKRLEDQKARLLARLMLLYSLQQAQRPHLIHTWAKGPRHKPYIQDWDAFSISHSGDMVVFCHGPLPLGIDVEKRMPSTLAVLDYLHSREQALIAQASDPEHAFYDIWVRKEAFLKATGLGISEGMADFDCSGPSIRYQDTDWHFHCLSLASTYTSYLCLQDPQSRFCTEQFEARLTDFAFLKEA
jgi:4'-phosphopantetheinyl transferase